MKKISNDINSPLSRYHIIVDNDKHMCNVCHTTFKQGQRTTLVPMESTMEGNKCRALVAHANCVYKGMLTNKGFISRIKDGDGSPYPVIIGSKQYKLSEVCYV